MSSNPSLQARRNISMSLPPEILLLVFNHHVENSYFHDPIPQAQVCKYWRTVALSSPLLWSKLIIDPAPTMFDLTRTQLHLERSRAAPFSISICDASLDQNITHKPPITQILNAILSCAPRWRSISLRLSPPAFHQLEREITSRETGGMEGCSNLRTASISPYIWDSSTASLRHVWSFLHKSSCLEDVSWGAGFERARDIQFTSCPPLRRISFSMAADGELLAILALLPTLEDVQMSNYIIDGIASGEEQPVLHSRLRKLSLTLTHDSSPLLSRLNLPSLSDLVIHHVMPVSCLPSAALKNFLLRSGCALSTFSLQDMYATGSQIALHLQGSPFSTLKDLSIASGLLDDDFVSLLSRRNERTGHAFAPSLAHLSLYSVIRCTDGLVSKMIRSRFDDGKGPLRTAFVWGAQVEGYGPHPIDIDTMDHLYRMGLEGSTA